MLKTLTRQYVNGGVGVKLRFPLISMLYLEHFEVTYEDLKERKNIAFFANAGIIGAMISEEMAIHIVNTGDYSYFEGGQKTTLKWLESNGEKAFTSIVNAWVDAYPAPDIGEEIPDEPQGTDHGTLRGIYCDILHRSDGEFWTSTYKEIMQRWDKYAEIKGYKEPVTVVRKHYDG